MSVDSDLYLSTPHYPCYVRENEFGVTDLDKRTGTDSDPLHPFMYPEVIRYLQKLLVGVSWVFYYLCTNKREEHRKNRRRRQIDVTREPSGTRYDVVDTRVSVSRVGDPKERSLSVHMNLKFLTLPPSINVISLYNSTIYEMRLLDPSEFSGGDVFETTLPVSPTRHWCVVEIFRWR